MKIALILRTDFFAIFNADSKDKIHFNLSRKFFFHKKVQYFERNNRNSEILIFNYFINPHKLHLHPKFTNN